LCSLNLKQQSRFVTYSSENNFYTEPCPTTTDPSPSTTNLKETNTTVHVVTIKAGQNCYFLQNKNHFINNTQIDELKNTQIKFLEEKLVKHQKKQKSNNNPSRIHKEVRK